MTCVMLHNLCIAKCNPCKPRWRLTVEQLDLSNRDILCQPNKKESNENASGVADWLWEHYK